MGKRDSANVMLARDFEKRRLSWIARVGPTLPKEFLLKGRQEIREESGAEISEAKYCINASGL
jgi:hypothetical protein